MKAATINLTQRGQKEQARVRALVRFNSIMFHGLAAASFLETAVPQHVGRLGYALGADAELRMWLEQVWWPRRAELGRQLRSYIEVTWPEFDWNGGYREFQDNYRPLSALEGSRARAAREVLGLCVMEAQAALFYRALAKTADEPQLRVLAGEAASDHAEFFEYLRARFDRYRRLEHIGFIATLRTVNAVCRSARDHDVAIAFHALARSWAGDTIVPGLAYSEFRRRTTQLLMRHVALGPFDRLLFRPWFDHSDGQALPQSPVQPQGRWLPIAVPATGA
ncbi:MAG TPA: hypothetical protein VJQ51_06505 [Burkholderiales bacterium]|nr:hypothetical protein [Burkholderiales bacterium]